MAVYSSIVAYGGYNKEKNPIYNDDSSWTIEGLLIDKELYIDVTA
jgi:hypothetical protein